mmetsp:Transcript_131263/g.245638  ORF Transcript_131263/g.245638 Transcript_131263/m.245638 type:complete len:526 (+) Transcript_131263:79-1656(+)
MEVLPLTMNALLAETRPDNVEVIVDRLTQVELSHALEFEQTVNNMMAEIGTDNVDRIVNLLAEVELTSAMELQQSVNAVLAEICADTVDIIDVDVDGPLQLELPGGVEPDEVAEQPQAESPRETLDAKLRELDQKVSAILAEIGPDNVQAVVDRIVEVQLESAVEMQRLVATIFSKVLDEPHHGEAYADMVSALRARLPEFPPEREGEKRHRFFRILLNTCQNYFESSMTCVTQENKHSSLACMKFFGHLYLRNLLGLGALDQVVFDLVGAKEDGKLPEEHAVECVCNLLQIIGHALEETSDGQNLMCSFIARLRSISQEKNADGTDSFSTAVRSQIEDLLALRLNRWRKERAPEQEKTKVTKADARKWITPPQTMSEELSQTRQALESSDAKRRSLEKELKTCQCKVEQQLERQRSDEQRIAELTLMLAEMQGDQAALAKLTNERLEALQNALTSSTDRLQRHRISRLQRQVDEVNCRVCLERPRKVVLLPCKHVPLCVECLGNLEDAICPMCRAPIEDTIQTF